jgi:hypothetical protein
LKAYKENDTLKKIELMFVNGCSAKLLKSQQDEWWINGWNTTVYKSRWKFNEILRCERSDSNWLLGEFIFSKDVDTSGQHE